MNNFDVARKTLETSMNSEGSANKELEKWKESLKAKINELKASWTSLSETFMKTDFLGTLISGLSKIVEFIDKIISSLGSVGTITAGLTILQIFRKDSILTPLLTFMKTIKSLVSNSYLGTLISTLRESSFSFENLGTAAKMACKDFVSFAKTGKGAITVIGIFITLANLAINALKNAEAERQQARDELLSKNNDMLDSIDSLEQIYAKYGNKTSLTSDEQKEFKQTVENTSKALGDKSNALKELIKTENDYVNSLDKVANAEIQDAQIVAKENLKAATDNLKKASYDWTKGGTQVEIWYRPNLEKYTDTESDKKAKELMEELMGDYIAEYNENDFDATERFMPKNWKGANTDVKDIIDYYYRLIKVKDTLVKKSIEENNDAWINNQVYEDVTTVIDRLSDSVQEYIAQQYNIEKYNYEIQHGIPKTIVQYNEMRNAILGNIDASQEYKDALAEIMDTEWSSVFDLSELDNINNQFQTTASEIAKNANLDLTRLFNNSNNPIIDEKSKNSINEYLVKVGKLKEGLTKYKSGNLLAEDMRQLLIDFPELKGKTDNLDSAIINLVGDLNNDMVSKFANQFDKLDTKEDIQELEAFQDAVLETGSIVGLTQISIDISAESDNMGNFFGAIKESISSIGLTADSINNLKARYQDLDNYDAAKLFEKTSNGIHLNTKALRELESEYEKQQKSDIDLSLKALNDEYDNLTERIKNCSDASQKSELYNQRNSILQQINDTAQLAAQYEGLTSAFYKWEQAQSIGEEGDMYDSLTNSLKDIKELYDKGLIGTNKFRAAVQLMTSEDLSTASVDELTKAYDDGYSKMTRYFTDSENGCLKFLEDVSKLNSEWASMNEDGTWEINFGKGNDQEIADALGMNVEAVQAILRKLSDYGFDINLDSIYSSFDDLKIKAEKSVEDVNKALKKLGKYPVSFDFETDNIEDITQQITRAQNVLDNFRNEDGTVNLELDGAEEAEEILVTLITKKQTLSAPAIMSIDTTAFDDADADIANTISLLQQFIQYSNDLEVETSLGIDTTDTQEKLKGVATELAKVPDEVKTKVGIDDEELQTAIDNISNTGVDVEAGVNINNEDIVAVQTAINNIVPENIELTSNSSAIQTELENVNEYKIDDKVFKVSISNNPTSELGRINSYVIKDKEYKIIAKTETKTAEAYGTARVNGTAYSQGTIGKAFKQGNWGTKDSGVALGGELGEELVN